MKYLYQTLVGFILGISLWTTASNADEIELGPWESRSITLEGGWSMNPVTLSNGRFLVSSAGKVLLFGTSRRNSQMTQLASFPVESDGISVAIQKLTDNTFIVIAKKLYWFEIIDSNLQIIQSRELTDSRYTGWATVIDQTHILLPENTFALQTDSQLKYLELAPDGIRELSTLTVPGSVGDRGVLLGPHIVVGVRGQYVYQIEIDNDQLKLRKVIDLNETGGCSPGPLLAQHNNDLIAISCHTAHLLRLRDTGLAEIAKTDLTDFSAVFRPQFLASGNVLAASNDGNAYLLKVGRRSLDILDQKTLDGQPLGSDFIGNNSLIVSTRSAFKHLRETRASRLQIVQTFQQPCFHVSAPVALDDRSFVFVCNSDPNTTLWRWGIR